MPLKNRWGCMHACRVDPIVSQVGRVELVGRWRGHGVVGGVVVEADEVERTPEHLRLLGGERRQPAADEPPHRRRVLAVRHGVHEPPEHEVEGAPPRAPVGGGAGVVRLEPVRHLRDADLAAVRRPVPGPVQADGLGVGDEEVVPRHVRLPAGVAAGGARRRRVRRAPPRRHDAGGVAVHAEDRRLVERVP
ncbi:Os08g0509450 [Oryza sativa Japonica Group]|uniref:Os08g0509450 protein n=1 Tax=Oryza sativa subsp. japonica TaxID=39947 RepID=A0A0P0XHS9_ORYSJ|nr:hypothetical protein EE612_045275 [Oryza sativa]BAT06185.1 Os08g0509450 [Oryza sativa Japonica Group]